MCFLLVFTEVFRSWARTCADLIARYANAALTYALTRPITEAERKRDSPKAAYHTLSLLLEESPRCRCKGHKRDAEQRETGNNDVIEGKSNSRLLMKDSSVAVIND